MFIDEAQNQQSFSVFAMKLQKLEHLTVHDDDNTLE